MIFISEIRYRNGPNFPPDGDYIEISAPAGTDVSNVTVEVYNANGTVRSTTALSGLTPVTVNGVDYYIVNERINRFGAVSLVENGSVSAFYSFDGTVMATAGAAAGMTSTIIGSTGSDDTASLSSTDGQNFFVDNNPNPGAPPCFVAGTLLQTPNGEVAVEQLDRLDLVVTLTGVSRPIKLHLSRKYGRKELLRNPALYPVKILAGALGQGLPRRDLLVSRQHRMLVSSAISQRMFGSPEVLIPAIKLTKIPGIFVDTAVTKVEYFHLVLDEHEVIFAEGAPTESLLTGPSAMKAMSPEAREELFTIFPELMACHNTTCPAFPIPTNKRQKQLVARHAKNRKALLGSIAKKADKKTGAQTNCAP